VEREQLELLELVGAIAGLVSVFGVLLLFLRVLSLRRDLQRLSERLEAQEARSKEERRRRREAGKQQRRP
jgi:hypothetical protein